MINQLALVNIKKDRDGFDELKKRVLFVILAVVLFRIGSFIPIPGINTILLSKLLESHNGTIVDMFNMFSGGAVSRASIFSLGIMPYISASIIIQLLALIYSPLSEMKKEGELGRKKINQYIRYTTLFLSIVQSIGIAISLPNMPVISSLVINPDIYFIVTAITSLVAGTIFLMWLGELITERGIGNGISVIIFIGIITGLPGSIGTTIEEVRKGNLHFSSFFFAIIFIFLILFFVVYIERSQRKIIVHYARRQQGRRMYIAQSTHLPLKLNMSGVIPAIFASSVMFFPATIVAWFSKNNIEDSWIRTMIMYLQPTQPVYIILYSIFIIFFCFFYTGLIFSPRETADNLKKSGAFISGIRPGIQTAQYISRIMLRLTCLGSIYMTFICLIPEFIRYVIKVPFYFGGTSLLIVVVVIIDIITQIQTLIMSNQYESMLKKSNLNL